MGKRFFVFLLQRPCQTIFNLFTPALAIIQLRHPGLICLSGRVKNTIVRLNQSYPTKTQHTGSLLVALPSLLDPSFRRTILLITHHDQEGAMGFILNRPRNESLGELTESTMDLAAVPVFEGGPVEQQNLILTHLLWKETGVRFQSLGEEDLAQLDSQEGHNGDPDHDRHRNLRAFTGFAGWMAGQLEQEIAEKSWHLLKPTAEMLHPVSTTEDGIKHWKAIMKELGPMYYMLAQAPDDPGLN